METTPRFVMMCGLPGSGKSYYAKQLAEKENFVICSSDALRQELYGDINDQSHNEKVFQELHKRIKENLKAGKNVIYDACNISSKQRKAFIAELGKIDCQKECIIVASPYEDCLKSNQERDRTIPTNAITTMYKNWTTPYYFEGWDKIDIVYRDNVKKLDAEEWIRSNLNYNQDNPHHMLTLGEHSLTVAHDIKKDPVMYYTGLLHDCGKPFTQTHANMKGEPTEDAHYFNHQNVGAYDSFFFQCEGLSQEDQLKMSVLINLHMAPFSWEGDLKNGDKTKTKFEKLWGDDIFQKVMQIHKADTSFEKKVEDPEKVELLSEKREAAKNLETDEYILDALGDDTDLFVKLQVLRNPNTKPETIRRIAKKEPELFETYKLCISKEFTKEEPNQDERDEI
jgi:predicted kinase